jgi:hypothetical protein
MLRNRFAFGRRDRFQLLRVRSAACIAATMLAGCTPEAPRPIAKLAEQPVAVDSEYITLGLSRIPMPPGQWKLIQETTSGPRINLMFPGEVDDAAIKRQVYVSMNPAGRISGVLSLTTNSKVTLGFMPIGYCVNDEKQTEIYYKDIAANASNYGDCLKVRRVEMSLRGRGSDPFSTRVNQAVTALGGTPSRAVESTVAIARNRSAVVVMRYDFPPGGMEDETSWKAASLGAAQRDYVQTIAASAERMRPLILRGTGTAM